MNGIPNSLNATSINRRNFLAGLAALGLTCGIQEKAAAMSAITNQNSDMILSAQLRQIDDRLLNLTYQVQNTSDRTMYLFDVLHGEFDGSVFPLVDACYATIEQGQLVLSRQIVPVPDDVLVDVENIPFVTAMRPGASIEKTVKQPKPVFPWTPYTDHDNIPEPKGVLQMNVWFRLGYFLAAPGTSELVEAVPTDDGTRPAFNPFPYESQRLLMTGPLGTVDVYDMG
jgi:hypothetical protein